MASTMRGTLVPTPAVEIAAAERHLDLAADHLAHHVGGALRDVRRMRDDHDADGVAHVRASSALQTAWTMTQLDRAPGSM